MTRRFAISLPDDLFHDIERARRWATMPRSRWMQDAARQYLKHESREELIEAYFEAYERIPEGTEEDDEWPELED